VSINTLSPSARRYQRVWAAIIAALFVASAAAVGAPAATASGGTASISGTVSLASSPITPVEGVQVQLVSADFEYYDTQSNSAGEFMFGLLPTGNYRVGVNSTSSGLVGSWWNGAASQWEAEVISITEPGQVVSDITFLLVQGGSITGVVTGPSGEPLENVLVSAQPVDPQANGRFASTNAAGEYEIVGVESTDYRLRFEPMAGNVRPQYWPGVDDQVDAGVVVGLLGQQVSGRSIQLPEGAVISGTVTDALSGEPLADIAVTVGRIGNSWFSEEKSTTTGIDGTWSIAGLAPGPEWAVQFRDQQGAEHYGYDSGSFVTEYYDGAYRFTDASPLLLQIGTPLPGIDASLDRPATLSGRVTDAGGAPLADMRVELVPNTGSYTLTDDDGFYSESNIPPGSYRVLVGDIDNPEPAVRGEWFDNAYAPESSELVTFAAGETRANLDIELATNSAPQYPDLPLVTVVGAGTADASLIVDMPSTGAPADGLNFSAAFAREGDGFRWSVFDAEFPYEYSLNWGGGGAQALTTAQAWGPDGYGPAVRRLVTIGDGPALDVVPQIQVSSRTETSLDIVWTIAGETVDGWTWQLNQVNQPGEQQIVWELADFDAPTSSGATTVTGLEPGTTYEFFVVGSRSSGDYGSTYWGRALLTTSAQPWPEVPRFSDVPLTRAFATEINWLASTGVANGYSDGTFRPLGTVNRDAMAAFLYRFAGRPAFSPPSVSPFTDVTPSTPFYREITWLASTGVTGGFSDGSFRPAQPVNRDAMAAFLFRFDQRGLSAF
jgi:hypothetical protein